MAKILLKDVSLAFPNYDIHSFSIKNVINTLKKNQNVRKELNIFDSLNFAAKKNDKIGVYGPNGSGKTTLLRLLSGIYSHNGGTFKVEGTISALLDLTAGFDMELSGYENIIIRGLIIGLTYDQINMLINDIIEFSELSDSIYKPLRIYSSGMIVRLAFAIVTSIKRDIIIMDEWLAVGDQAFTKKAEKKLKQTIDNSSILVIASHDKALLKKICNKVFLMDKKLFIDPRLL